MRRCFLVGAGLVLGSLFSAFGAPPSPTPAPPPSASPQLSSFVVPADPSHPVRLNFPFGWIGELKLPTKDELASRDKLQSLADLTDLEVRCDLEKWPPYNNMSLSDQGKMLQRIQDFRDRRTKLAQDEAQKLGLTNLSPEDQMAFTKLFWLRRRQADEELLADFQPKYNSKQGEIDHELQETFAPRSPSPVPSTTPAVTPQSAPASATAPSPSKPEPASTTPSPSKPEPASTTPSPSKPEPASTTPSPSKPEPASSVTPSPKPTPATKPTPSTSPK